MRCAVWHGLRFWGIDDTLWRMRDLKSTCQLNRLCEHLSPRLETQQYMRRADDTGLGVPLAEEALERRWESRQAGIDPSQLPTVAYPLTAFSLQFDRVKSACTAAACSAVAATGTEKLLLQGMHACRFDLVELKEAATLLARANPPAPQSAWCAALDDVYALSKAMQSAMQRLSQSLCYIINLSTASESRGQFGYHETYALAALLEHIPGHELPCAQVQAMVSTAYLRAKRRRAELKTQLSAEQRETLQAFRAHPMVNAVLEDLHDLVLDKKSNRPNDRSIDPAMVEVMRDPIRGKPLLAKAQKARQDQDIIFAAALGGVKSTSNQDLEGFLKSAVGRKLIEQWNAAYVRGIEPVVKPTERARFCEKHSLRVELGEVLSDPRILDLEELLAGPPFAVPETLHKELKALQSYASNRRLSEQVRGRLGALRKEISALYHEAIGYDRIALELQFVLNKDTQRRLHALRKSLEELKAAVAARPKLDKPQPRRAEPTSVANGASPMPSPRAPAHAEAASDNDEYEEVAGCELQVEVAGPASERPTTAVMWCGHATPLRTRLGNQEALDLIAAHMACGTFRTPMSSAIYHYRRHVLLNAGAQPPDVQPLHGVTIEDYISAGKQRFADWDGHTVTYARSSGELLALVDARPKGWFTRDGKIVSYCYEDR